MTNGKLSDLSERFNEFISKYDKAYSELQQCYKFKLMEHGNTGLVSSRTSHT